MSILGRTEVFKHRFFRWNLVKFTFTRFDGTVSTPAEHLVFERGDSVGMLLHDLQDDTIVLVEQIRIATEPITGGWLRELPAGRVDEGEEPITSARREVKEETGAESHAGEEICAFYPSPGACSERIHLFYFPFPNGLTTGKYGGLVSEGEDIAIHRVPRMTAFSQVASGEIIDAKAIIGLRWLEARTPADQVS